MATAGCLHQVAKALSLWEMRKQLNVWCGAAAGRLCMGPAACSGALSPRICTTGLSLLGVEALGARNLPAVIMLPKMSEVRYKREKEINQACSWHGWASTCNVSPSALAHHMPVANVQCVTEAACHAPRSTGVQHPHLLPVHCSVYATGADSTAPVAWWSCCKGLPTGMPVDAFFWKEPARGSFSRAHHVSVPSDVIFFMHYTHHRLHTGIVLQLSSTK